MLSTLACCFRNKIIVTFLWGMGDSGQLRLRILPIERFHKIEVLIYRRQMGLPVKSLVIHAGFLNGDDKVSELPCLSLCILHLGFDCWLPFPACRSLQIAAFNELNLWHPEQFVLQPPLIVTQRNGWNPWRLGAFILFIVIPSACLASAWISVLKPFSCKIG